MPSSKKREIKNAGLKSVIAVLIIVSIASLILAGYFAMQNNELKKNAECEIANVNTNSLNANITQRNVTTEFMDAIIARLNALHAKGVEITSVGLKTDEPYTYASQIKEGLETKWFGIVGDVTPRVYGNPPSGVVIYSSIDKNGYAKILVGVIGDSPINELSSLK